MQGSPIKHVLVTMMLASALSLSACSDDDDIPTAPTQPGPPVSTPAPAPEPTPPPAPPPAPTPAPDAGTAITVNGVVSRMSRSGQDGIDVVFRVGDETFVRGDAATVVIDGSSTSNTSAIREGQIVTVDALQRADDVYAQRVVINSQ